MLPKPGSRKLKLLCLACETNDLDPREARNSASRFCDAYICSSCGMKEAIEGFFWSIRAKAAGCKLNDAGLEVTR